MKVKTIKTRLLAWLLAIAVLVSGSIVLTPGEQVYAETLTPVQAHGQLSVSGTQIVDQKGQAFQLRGVSTHGINWDVGRPYVNQAAFQTLRDDWGANAIRLAMYTAEYNGYCTGGNQAELKGLLRTGVDAAKNLGMYAIIDWHVLNDQNPLTYLEQAKGFWSETSAAYKDYNNVLYEICNEPNNCSWDDIKNYANQIIPIIRANDPDAIIIVGTPTWSQLGMWGHTNEVADSPLTGYNNLVYTLHFYCAEASHTQYLPAKVDYAVSKGLPILVSEFGLSAASGDGAIDTNQADVWLNKLDGYKIGYFAWSLSNKAESSALISSGCGKTSGWSEGELTDAGRYIRSRYQARREVIEVKPVDEKQVDAFVTRLYKLVLGRKPESSGKAYWKAELCNRRKTGAEVGYGFVFSPEYTAKKTSDKDFVEMLYKVYMNRNSDAEGLKYWTGLLQQGVSREYVFKGFVDSKEYLQICDSYGIERGTINLKQARDKNVNLTRYVNRLYQTSLGRGGEPDGLNYWCGAIQGKTTTPVKAAECFICSPEFEKKHLSDTEYVKVLYRTFMGREYDKTGLNYWVGRLNKGESRKTVLKSFAGCPEFQNIVKSFGL